MTKNKIKGIVAAPIKMLLHNITLEPLTEEETMIIVYSYINFLEVEGVTNVQIEDIGEER